MDEFYKSWWWLRDHPYYHDPRVDDVNMDMSVFQICTDIFVAKINPKTKMVDDNNALNTEVEIWIETGCYIFEDPYDNGGEKILTPTHDYRMDCGSKTYEEAIIELAKLVKEFIGDYTRDSKTGVLINWDKRKAVWN